MAKDIERGIAQAALWAVRWRELELEAFKVTCSLSDPEAKRHMLFVSEYFGSLAKRADKHKRNASTASSTRAPKSRWRWRGQFS
jgi:hypothetical protein